ncbi:MAG: putative lipoprotein [Ascidiaceihabitans sp.]|jgi:predicted lipoprotein
MRQLILALAATILPLSAMAENAVTAGIVNNHILPRFERLAEASNTLSRAAATDCTAASVPLRAAYADAFDAWVAASHLRFGPTEVGDRSFAIAFWPDSRGATPKALNRLIADQDPIAKNADDYAAVSIAARGFYALEFLLYDATLSTAGDDQYRCALIQTIAADTAAMASAISDDWGDEYAARLLHPTAQGTYRSDDEVRRELLKALSTGLQFTTETRLGRPLGTFDKPRPKRAEAWRSDRSARHVTLSLQTLKDLAGRLADDNVGLANDLDAAFDDALTRLADLNDPTFASVADPQRRIKIEVIQQSVESIRVIVRDQLGPELGVDAGFNALDGD